MRDRKAYIVVLLLAFVLAGCKTDEPSQKVGIPISICLPANEVHSANKAPRREIGDPGTTEKFLFPQHLYFIVMRKTGETTWSLWAQEHRKLKNEDWIPERYEWNLPTQGDSIYRYNAEIIMPLASSDKFVGHVYAIASAEELTFNKSLAAITDLNDLLNLTFDASSDAIQANLQHIYSSPYNLKVDGAYYGSFNSNHQKVPHIDFLLYHVAAKVDIQWNVVDTMRINKTDPSKAVRLTYMEARYLFNGNAYCFRPMRNELAALPSTGYTRANIVRPTDEGLWWEGRSYFYTIPYTVTGEPDYFPLQMRLCTNGTAVEHAYRPTLKMQVDTPAVFVPWMRVRFKFTQPLEDKEETKIVDY